MRVASAASLFQKNALLLILIAAFTGGAVAQTTATLSGSVRLHDNSKAVIPNAKLTLTNLGDNGHVRTATSDSNGDFSFTSILSGRYRLECHVQGFKTWISEGIVLTIGETVRLDISLEAGSVSETVTVTTDAQLLQIDSNSVGQVIGREITALPLTGRSFYQLAILQPGVMAPTGGLDNLFGFPGVSPLASAGASVGVTRDLFAPDGGFRVVADGMNVNDRLLNTPTAQFTVDAIEQLAIGDSYSAETSSSSRVVAKITTQKGTNQFHGSIFEYFKNDRLNARNFFDLADANQDGKLDRPVYQSNHFGFSLGGPLLKNRAFFFGNGDWLRSRVPQSRVMTVPTAKMRQGDFSEFGDGNPATTTDVDIHNPFVNGRPVFAGNLIPHNLWNSVAQDLLALLPQPNRPGLSQNLAAAPPARNQTNQFIVRLDYAFGDKDQISGRFIYSDLTANSPFGSGAPLPGFGLNLSNSNQNLSVTYTRSWSRVLGSEIRFGYNRISGGQEHQNKGNTIGLRNGIAGLFSTGKDEIGVPRISITGLSPFGDESNTFNRDSRDYQFDGTVTYVKGSHSLKLGGSFQPISFSPLLQNNVRGSFSFGASAATSGLGFADFLLGLPDSASSGSVAAANFKGNEFNWFVHDKWNLNSKLTLDYGLRYEYQQPLVDQKLQAANFDLNSRAIIIPYKDGQTAAAATFRSAPGGVFVCSGVPCFPVRSAADLGIHAGLIMPDRNNFGPRFGFAWKISNFFVARGGYGLYYSHQDQTTSLTMVARPPFSPSASLGPTVSPCLAQTQQICDGAARLQIQNALASPGSGAFLSPVNPFLRTGYTQQWNLNLQTSLKRNWNLGVEYFGSKGTRLFNIDSRNYRLPAATTLSDNTREFFPYIFGMEARTDSGFSNNHNLQVKLMKRLAEGFAISGNYIWSKSIDNVNGNGSSNPSNRLAEKARSDFDARHRVGLNSVYELPFGNGRKFAGKAKGIRQILIGNWQFAFDAAWRAATPFTVESPFDFSNIGRIFANRPDLLGDPNNGPKNAEQWFKTNAFGNPTRGVFGTAGRNILDGDTQTAINISLLKVLRKTERVKVELRAEVSNSTNDTYFPTPNRITTSRRPFAATDYQAGASDNINPNFGRMFSSGDPRIAQLTLKVTF